METKKWMIVVIGYNDADHGSAWLDTIEYVSGTELQVQAELINVENRAIEKEQEEAWQDYLEDFNNPELEHGPEDEYLGKEDYLIENPIDTSYEVNYVEYTDQKFRIL